MTVPNKKLQSPSSGFDFRINVPPPEAVSSPTPTDLGVDEHMIGIALGSPRMVGAHHMMSQMQEKVLSTAVDPPKPAPIQRKPSKWKKIGGFFKAKSAMTSGAASQPFYQVQSGGKWPLQGSSHSLDYKPRSQPETTEPKPISNTEVWPCLVTEPEPKPDKSDQKTTPVVQTPPKVESVKSAQPSKNGEGPMLQIDIPDVQMERYSVMFGGLLSRRSKTLDDITTTPSFTLFPATQITKASKVLGTPNIPQGPSPFHRSQTSLVEASSRDLSNNEQDHIFLMVHSPSLKSPSSHKTHHSVSSFISSTSSLAEIDEKQLLQTIKPVKSYVDPTEEPQWEIINKSPSSQTGDLKQKLAQSLTINTRELPSESASSGSASSSPILSPLNSVTEKLISPAGSKPVVSPAESMRMPPSEVVVNEDDKEDEEDDDHDDDHDDLDATEPINAGSISPLPRVEVSIARSVSVSKGKKQMIVPIRPRADRLSPDERLINRAAKTPQVMDAQYRHRHGNSQELRIESV
ncbi:hypothetical protein ATERTT37_000725 [Aspergillus terreus]